MYTHTHARMCVCVCLIKIIQNKQQLYSCVWPKFVFTMNQGEDGLMCKGPPGLILSHFHIFKSHEHLFLHVWPGTYQSIHSGAQRTTCRVSSPHLPCGL